MEEDKKLTDTGWKVTQGSRIGLEVFWCLLGFVSLRRVWFGLREVLVWFWFEFWGFLKRLLS